MRWIHAHSIDYEAWDPETAELYFDADSLQDVMMRTFVDRLDHDDVRHLTRPQDPNVPVTEDMKHDYFAMLISDFEDGYY